MDPKDRLIHKLRAQERNYHNPLHVQFQASAQIARLQGQSELADQYTAAAASAKEQK